MPERVSIHSSQCGMIASSLLMQVGVFGNQVMLSCGAGGVHDVSE